MSYEERFDAALALIEEHNKGIGDHLQPGFVKIDDFASCIKAAGGTSEEGLKRFSYEDIADCLPTTNGKKAMPLARRIGELWRGKEEAKRPPSSRRIERMTLEELVSDFDVEEPDSPIGERLNKASKGQPFIVFETARIVDEERTLKLLKELKAGLKEGRTAFEGKKVYRVGELPDNYANENPLYEGRPLRPLDESCDQTNRSWAGVPFEVRQFIRFAMDYEGGIEVNSHKDAHDVLDVAVKPDALKTLRDRYSELAVEFDNIKTNNPSELPTLRISLGEGSVESSDGEERPFEDGKRVVWMTPQGHSIGPASLADKKWSANHKMLRSSGPVGNYYQAKEVPSKHFGGGLYDVGMKPVKHPKKKKK